MTEETTDQTDLAGLTKSPGLDKAPSENEAAVSAADVPASNEQAAQPDAPHHKHKRTAGELIHREFTYRGIDWGLNSALAIAFSFRVKRNLKWHTAWDNTAGKLSRGFWGLFVKGDSLKTFVESSKMFLSILVGGTLIIPLIMGLENRHVKKSIVHTLDRWIYGKDRVDNDPRFTEAYKEIEHEPKKGFWVGMGARILALMPMYTIMVLPFTGRPLDKFYYQPIATGTKWLAEHARIRPPKSWLVPKEEATAAELLRDTENIHGEMRYMNHWNFVHYMIGYDFGMTVFYSVLHEFFYNLLSRRSSNHKEQHAEHREERAEEKLEHEVAKKEQPEAPKEKPKHWKHAKHESPQSTVRHISRETHQAEVAQVNHI